MLTPGGARKWLTDSALADHATIQARIAELAAERKRVDVEPTPHAFARFFDAAEVVNELETPAAGDARG